MLHKITNSQALPPQKTSHGLFLATHNGAPGQDSSTSNTQRRYPIDLLLITARRCSAFFAEAAVLVLVFGILDLCLLRGHLQMGWIIGALGISLGLLGASIAMDFSAQRWARACP